MNWPSVELKVRNAGINYWEVIKNGYFTVIYYYIKVKCAALHAGIHRAMSEKKTLQVLE